LCLFFYKNLIYYQNLLWEGAYTWLSPLANVLDKTTKFRDIPYFEARLSKFAMKLVVCSKASFNSSLDMTSLHNTHIIFWRI
jgi:hypothetical protein